MGSPQKENKKESRKENKKSLPKEEIKTDKKTKFHDNTIKNKIQSRGIYNVLVDDIIEVEVTENDINQQKEFVKWKKDTLMALLKRMKESLGYDQLKAIVNRELQKE